MAVGCIIIMNDGRHDWGGSQPVILPALSVFGTDRQNEPSRERLGARRRKNVAGMTPREAR
jgi:hypothetical protein